MQSAAGASWVVASLLVPVVAGCFASIPELETDPLPAGSASSAGGAGAAGSGGAGSGGGAAGSAYAAAVLADSPIAYWRLGETEGSEAADASGNGRVGIYTGGVMLEQPGALASDGDTAVCIGGGRGYVLIQDGGALDFAGTASFTIEAWASAEERDVTFRGLVNKLDTGAEALGYEIALQQDDGLFVRRSSDAAASDLQYTEVPLVGWHHIVSTYDGTSETLKLFVDGELVANMQNPGNLVVTEAPLVLGARGGGSFNFWKGCLDEVAMYGKALSDGRVRAHYQTGIGR